MNAAFGITYSTATFPAGTVVDHIRVSVTGQNNPMQSQSVAPGTASVSFTVAPDTYSYAVDTIDGAGNVLAEATGSFVASGPQTVNLQVATGAHVTVG